jgi:hypothetical protein
MSGERHPAARIRTTSVLGLVALGLLARDLVRIWRWAGDARQLEREIRRAHAREVNDLEGVHDERVRELKQDIDRLLETLHAKPTSGSVEGNTVTDAVPIEPEEPAGE